MEQSIELWLSDNDDDDENTQDLDMQTTTGQRERTTTKMTKTWMVPEALMSKSPRPCLSLTP